MHRKFGETVLSWPRVLIRWLNWQLLFFLVLFFKYMYILFYVCICLFLFVCPFFFIHIFTYTRKHVHIVRQA